MSKFTRDDVTVLENKPVYQGFFEVRRFTLQHALYNGGESQPLSRELFVRGESVGVLLYDPVNQLVGLVQQFRVGALNDPNSPWLYEVVAGMREEHQSVEETAKREVSEETGLVIESLERICSYWVSPGGCDEKLHLFCAYTDLSEAGGHYGSSEENEDILFQVLTVDQVARMFSEGVFNNAATVIALQWLQLKLKDG